MIAEKETPRLARNAFILLCLGLIGCAAPAPYDSIELSALVWPPPPANKRISFIAEIKVPADVEIEAGFFQKLVETIRGSEEQEILSPYGITVADDGTIYVVDNAYQAIHVFNPAKGKYSRFPKKPPDNFRNPVNIALGSEGKIYVSDSESALVHVFDDQGKRFIRSVAANRMQRPTGLTVNPVTKELLVLDTKSSLLFVFDEASLELKRIVGDAEQDEGDFFHFPTNIDVNVDGHVYVSDSLNFRVSILNANLEPLADFGSPGNAPGRFSRPKGLAIDSDGHVYVIDALFDNVQVFEPDGQILIAFGGPGNTPGRFWLPNAIYIDRHDRVYISDAYNQRIQVFQYWKEELAQ